MKKILFTLILPCALLSATAQEYIYIETFWEGDNAIPVEQIDSITFGESVSERLPELMAKDGNIKLFCEALQLTGLCDSLMGVYDNDFYYDSIVQNWYRTGAYALQKLRKGYTAFVETDAVYAAHGIHTIADLKAYAAEVYDEMYPEDAAVADPTDRRNSLNRFVAYHLLDRKGTKSNLTAVGISNDQAGNVKETYYRYKIDIADWYETMMPHSLLKCSSPAGLGRETVFINRRGLKDKADARGVLVEGAEIVNGAGYSFQGEAVNGYYHYINDIIAYDKQTQEVVLDEQIIVNNSTLSPELMNNGLRIDNPFPKLNSDNSVFLPNGSLKNVQVNSEDTRMYYMFNWSWSNMQTDEMMILGTFDITVKLPPLPAGTYELNMGYSASTNRHVVACWLDGEFVDTIDFRITADQLGWESDYDLETPEAIADNDRLLFEQGYRKGLDYCYRLGYNDRQRDCSYCLRRIITTFTTDGKSDHYLRFKSVNDTDDGSAQTMIDYFELCPTHLLKEYE